MAAVFEGFGMTILLPVLDFMEKGGDVTLLEQSGNMWPKIINILNYFGLGVTFQVLLIAAFIVLLTRITAVYAMQSYTAWLANEVRHTVRTRLYNAYISMEYGAYVDLSSGATLNLLTTETWNAGGSFNSLFAVFSNTFMLIGLFIVMLWLSVPITIFSFTVTSVSILFFKR